MFDELNDAVLEIFEIDSISEDENLAGLELWDSLSVLSLVEFLDSNYGVTLTADELENYLTLTKLKTLIKKSTSE